MNVYKKTALLGLGVGLISLSGCDSLRNTFGLDHYQPDEFNISDNPPLSIPKDYKLRPPVAGDGSSGAASVPSSNTKAQDLLIGPETNPTTTVSKDSGEKNLLSAAGDGQNTDPNIRETVNKEAALDTSAAGPLTQKIESWKKEAATNIASIHEEAPSNSQESEPSPHQ